MERNIEIADYCAKKYIPTNINIGTIIALKAIDAFSELPISAQTNWYSEQPRTKEYCLVRITHPTKDVYIVARWDTEQKCFISEETGVKIAQFLAWKRIKE